MRFTCYLLVRQTKMKNKFLFQTGRCCLRCRRWRASGTGSGSPDPQRATNRNGLPATTSQSEARLTAGGRCIRCVGFVKNLFKALFVKSLNNLLLGSFV